MGPEEEMRVAFPQQQPHLIPLMDPFPVIASGPGDIRIHNARLQDALQKLQRQSTQPLFPQAVLPLMNPSALPQELKLSAPTPMDSSSDEKEHAAKQLEVAEGLAQLFQSPQRPTPAGRQPKFTSIASAVELDDLELSELSPDESQQQQHREQQTPQRGNNSPAGVSPSKRGRRRKRSASKTPVEGYEYYNPNREFYGDDEDKLDPDYEALVSVSRKPGKNRARERPAVHAVQAQTDLEVKEIMRRNKNRGR